VKSYSSHATNSNHAEKLRGMHTEIAAALAISEEREK
jgi:hypothetical protein